MTEAVRQVAALVALRWRTVRSSRARAGLVGLAAGIGLLFVIASTAGAEAPKTLAFKAALVAPTAYLGFAILALLAPIAAGGGNELFPADQLVGFPVRPAATYLSSIVVAPLNIAWMSQSLVLMFLAGFLSPPGPDVLFAVTITACYIVFVTTLGHAVGWVVVGARTRRLGRQLVWAFTGTVGAAAVVTFAMRWQYAVLDRAPTRPVALSISQAAAGHHRPGVTVLVVLVAATAVVAALGARTCGWALRRASDRGLGRESRTMTRRPAHRSELRMLLAVDRASVVRSVPLRRGLLVLAIVPAGVAAVAAVSARSLILLPALVASGAGLLFGVNVFSLDGSGARWVSSLPHPPRLAALSKVWVLTETCLAAVLLATAVALARVPARPTVAQLVGLAASTVVSAAVVVAICLDLSINRPHRADLRSGRDQPAPPGAMAAYSMRLSATTTVIALVLLGAAVSGRWWAPLAAAVPVVTLAGVSVRNNLARWANPRIRAHVVETVASG